MFSQYYYSLGSFLALNHISCTSVHDQHVKSYNIKTVSRLVLSIQAYYNVNSRCFLNIIIIYDRFQPESQFIVPLIMINKVNVALLRQFLGLYRLSKLIISLTHNVFLIWLLFRIVSSLHQIHVTSVYDQQGKYCIIKTVSRHVLSIQAYYKVNSRCFLNIIII